MLKSKHLLTSTALSCFLVMCMWGVSFAAYAQPNVILISVDTLAADHLGTYGYWRELSPHLDEFAGQSVTFEDDHCSASYTLPSHFSMMTGVGAFTHKMIHFYGESADGNVLSTEIKTLAEYLRDSKKYVTFWVYDRSNAWLGEKRGMGRGFDQVMDLTVNDPGIVRDKMPSMLDEMVKKSKTDAKSIFLFLHTYLLHAPYQSMSQYAVGPAFYPSWGGLSSLFCSSAKRFWLGKYFEPNSFMACFNADSSDSRDLLRDYYDAGVRQADDTMASLFQQLKEKGLYDNSIIVLTGDHGESFNEHGAHTGNDSGDSGFQHGGVLYREVTHVPLFMKIPGISPMRITNPVSSLDIVPTVLEVSGVPRPERIEGDSLMPLLAHKKLSRKLSYTYAIADFGEAIWLSPWKLIRHPNGQKKLYRLDIDPYEKRNLSDLETAKRDELDVMLDAIRLKKISE